jgi:hypothetical protein
MAAWCRSAAIGALLVGIGLSGPIVKQADRMRRQTLGA